MSTGNLQKIIFFNNFILCICNVYLTCVMTCFPHLIRGWSLPELSASVFLEQVFQFFPIQVFAESELQQNPGFMRREPVSGDGFSFRVKNR